ncbi:MAG TPA: S8 family serine peptidase [Ardenticatenaceae bacterium]|jgi:uncharacterized repeat protein (TIGR01451 family)
MRRKLSAISALLFAVSLLVFASVYAADPSSGNRKADLVAASLDAVPVYGKLPSSGNVRIIVQLADAPLASYEGGTQGLAATSPSAVGAARLDPNSPASLAYLDYLAAQQANFLSAAQAVALDAKQLTEYRAAVNGVGLELPAHEVEALRRLPGVAAIYMDGIARPNTDTTPEYIGAPTLWERVGGQETAGENIVVGIIDTGVFNPSATVTQTQYAGAMHPSFADPSPVGGDYPSTFTYKGVCAPVNPQPQDGTFGPCNDKLIGAWWYNAGNADDPGEAQSPLDQDGHGTNVMSIAAGNAGTETQLGTISGVAPRARVIAYKVCWEEDPTDPEDGGCAFIDSVDAVDQAIMDGVHVLNYSIGGGESPWTEIVEQAFLGAVDAGVIVNTSAGNDTFPGTVGHISPWVMAVAATTEDQAYIGTLVLSDTNAPGPFQGSSVSPGSVTGNLVLAPPQSEDDETPSLCLEPYAPGTFEEDDIVICRRGINPRYEKYAFVAAGGAGAGILVNASPNQGLVADPCATEPEGFVCLHLEYNATTTSASGQELIEYVAANPGAMATVQGGIPASRQGDVLAGFSSQGPAVNNDLLKPDIAAPGVDILGGNSDFQWDINQPRGLFRLISGTSQASPHLAGSSALMRQLHPDWTPMEIKSALMTTSKNEGIFKPDGETAADPFNIGSGRVDLNTAAYAGLVLDETTENFEAANPAEGGDPKTLNLANFTDSDCVGTCSWTRTLRNASGQELTWHALTEAPAGMEITVEPSVFTIPVSGTQVITVSVDAVAFNPEDANCGDEAEGVEGWACGEVRLTTTPPALRGANAVPDVHFPVVVRPSRSTLPDAVIIETYRDAGSELIAGVEAIEITELTTREYGLTEGTYVSQTLEGDSDNGSPWDDLTDGIFTATVQVPADSLRLVAEITESPSLDIDLYVTYDADDNGVPEEGEVVCQSATGAVLEYCNLNNPAEGTYIIVVQNWEASAENAQDLVVLSYGIVAPVDAGNMDVTGPESVGQEEPFDLRVFYNVDSEVGDRWYGAFDVGSSPNEDALAAAGDLGIVAVDLRRLGNDVTKEVSDETIEAPGQYTLTYTITIAANTADEDVTYFLTDTIPAGLTYVEGSATGGATVAGNVLTWSGVQAAPVAGYTMTTSDNDAVCAEAYGYLDLEGIGVTANSALTGDDVVYYSAFGTGDPFNYYGQDYTGLALSTNGYVIFPGAAGAEAANNTPLNTNLPDPTPPNNLNAIFWDDLVVVYNEAQNHGISLAADAANTIALIEYDDAQLKGNPAATYDFQAFYLKQPSDAPGDYEISFAYDNITGPVDDVTVGIENADGTDGIQYTGPIEDGFAICFDARAAAADQVITYQVTTEELNSTSDCMTEYTNNAQHSTDAPGAMTETASATVAVVCDPTSVTLDDFSGSGSGGFPWLPAAMGSLLMLAAGLVALRRRQS